MKDQFLRFALVGAAATATTYVILIGLVEAWGVNPVVASLVGFMGGIVVNYALNYRFTFRSDKPHQAVAPRFLVVVLVGMVLNGALMYVGIHWLEVHYALAQLFAVAVVLLWSFAANRWWAFAP